MKSFVFGDRKRCLLGNANPKWIIKMRFLKDLDMCGYVASVTFAFELNCLRVLCCRSLTLFFLMSAVDISFWKGLIKI